MAQINFGGVNETVVSREEFPLEKARKVLENETIAVIGYGVQGPGQSLNLRDNGFNDIVVPREGTRSWERAVADGWVPGQTLFGIEEAAERGTIIQYLLSDAGQIAVWLALRKHLTAGKALYFSHGFGITYKERTGIVPPADVDVILIAPKGSGTSLRRMFLEGRGLNSSFAVFQDATGHAFERVVALGIGVGSGYLFETDFKREVYSDLTGERGTLMGAIQGIFGGLQRDGRGAHAVAHAARGRKRHGLDVCQLLDHGAARRARLVETLPRRCETRLRTALRRGGHRSRGTAVDRPEQQARLPPEARRGVARTA